jgi:carboxyl-terminal processing protease
MHKIADFIMSKKFLTVMLVLTAASLFIAFSTQGKNDRDDNPKSKYAKVLRNVGIILEEGHYSPKKIDDNFSKVAFKKFIEELDNEKNILLQSDIDAVKKYDTKLDDEIHGAEIKSFFEINEIYLQRLSEVSALFAPLLAKPFDFTKDEKIELDVDKISFAKTTAAREDMWRKRLKYLVLSKYADLQEEREKNKEKKDYKVKADSSLEREAREAIKKQMDRYFTAKIKRETKDENFSTFVNAITATMDPHTNYMPPIDLRSFNEQMSGSFFGIGAQLKGDDGKIKIASLVSGGPAWKQGDLKPEDEIIKIAQGDAEPVDVTGYDVTDAVKLIRGAAKGSTVKLTVKRPDGSIKVIAIQRDKVELEDTFAKSAVINGDKKIGYIYLPEFYARNPNGGRDCSEDVANEVKKLKAENVDGIVIDLRSNGGGSLNEVVKMTGLFIEDGPIVQVKSRDEKPYTWKDKDKSVLYDGPLTVMVNEFSASASEIFAAAIQDYKRGIVIGSTSTYGKGTVQRTIPLAPENQSQLFGGTNKEDELGSIKLTLQKFYRVSGASTQLKGVTPDIILPSRYEYVKVREKDNPTSLVWDEIAKADFKPSTTSVSNEASKYLKNSQSVTLGKLKTALDQIQKENDKEYSLQITKYKEEQKKMKATFKQLEELMKLPKDMVVKNASPDVLAADAPKDKVEKNNAWLKRLSADIYIDETVKVMNNMIADLATVKSK